MGRAGLRTAVLAACGAAALALLALVVPAQAANPYAAVRTVNGSVVTAYDIDQRTRFLGALGASGNLGELALQQLTEDRLKIQAGDAIGVELPPEAVEMGLEEFATSRGITIDDVLGVLDARDIDRQTIDDFVTSGIIWREVVGARFRARALPSEEEIDTALAAQATTRREMLHLAEIALPFAERGEAETLAFARDLQARLARGANFAEAARTYSRSDSAARDGAIDPMAADSLPASIRTQVLTLSPGQVTQPIPIAGGVAILKLVSISTEPPPKVDPSDPAAREAVRARLFNERVTAFGQGYLQELVSDALIVDR